jgi:cold shock protein
VIDGLLFSPPCGSPMTRGPLLSSQGSGLPSIQSRAPVRYIMGKYRDFRSRHGSHKGMVADQAFEPTYFQEPRKAESLTVDAEVLWFDTERGFGFVQAVDGSRAYLHIQTVKAAGKTVVSKGMQLKVHLQAGPKGPQVLRLVEANEVTIDAPTSRMVPHIAVASSDGAVRWYQSKRGIGFIRLAGTEQDVFFHASVLARCGLQTLTAGQKVLVKYAQGKKGLEALAIQLV